MEVVCDSALNLYSRLRPTEVSFDKELINDTNRVTIINISESDLSATNHFVYYICEKMLENGANIDSIDCDQLPEEPVQTDVNCSQRILEMSLSDEECEQTVDSKQPLILIYDCLETFDLQELANILTNVQQLDDIVIYKPIDENQLLISVNNNLRLDLALNQNLKLIVIYVNSTKFYPKIVDQINEILFSSYISVRTVVVVDSINKIQMKSYDDRQSFQVIKCESIDLTQIQVEAQVNGLVVRKRIGLKQVMEDFPDM